MSAKALRCTPPHCLLPPLLLPEAMTILTFLDDCSSLPLGFPKEGQRSWDMPSLTLLSSWLRVTPVGLHSPAFPQSVRTCEWTEAGSHRLVHHRVQLTSREGFSGLGRAPTAPSIEPSAQCPLSDLISYLLPLAHSVLPTLTLLAF